MHECPNCGQACDCDQEDVWHEYGADVDNCSHDCDDDDDDDDDDEWEEWDGEVEIEDRR